MNGYFKTHARLTYTEVATLITNVLYPRRKVPYLVIKGYVEAGKHSESVVKEHTPFIVEIPDKFSLIAVKRVNNSTWRFASPCMDDIDILKEEVLLLERFRDLYCHESPERPSTELVIPWEDPAEWKDIVPTIWHRNALSCIKALNTAHALNGIRERAKERIKRKNRGPSMLDRLSGRVRAVMPAFIARVVGK